MLSFIQHFFFEYLVCFLGTVLGAEHNTRQTGHCPHGGHHEHMDKQDDFRVTCALMSGKQVGVIGSDCGRVWVLLT